MELPVAISPCPNDTFLFHALLHGLVPSPATVTPTFGDIQQLNEWALEGRFPLIKLSYSTLAELQDTYTPLPVGSALGSSCGPMVIAREHLTLDELPKSRIAIPGRGTTANILLCDQIGIPENPYYCTYEEVARLVASGEVDAGVIIHETRFTYESFGLQQVCDLGQLWEERYGLSIPLGGLAIRSDLDELLVAALTRALQHSLKFAWQHPDISMDYILEHSIEKDPSVVRQHIDLYVNEETYQLSAAGNQAISTLFERVEALKELAVC